MIKIFVSYSWDSEEHKANVRALTNQLRKEGLHAEMDASLKQYETAIDFYKMMHKWIADSDKVIIVLSKGYKTKATTFTSGVGDEYGKIIKEINELPQKYILVSLEGISNDITPLELKGREIIDLSPARRKESFETILRKLFNKQEFEFEEVREKELGLQTKPIPSFLDDTLPVNPVPSSAKIKSVELPAKKLPPAVIPNNGTPPIIIKKEQYEVQNNKKDGISTTINEEVFPIAEWVYGGLAGMLIIFMLWAVFGNDANNIADNAKTPTNTDTGQAVNANRYMTGRINFFNDEGSINGMEMAKLDTLALLMKQNKDWKVVLIGEKGSPKLVYNRSKEEIKTVISYLTTFKNIEKDRLIVQKGAGPLENVKAISWTVTADPEKSDQRAPDSTVRSSH